MELAQFEPDLFQPGLQLGLVAGLDLLFIIGMSNGPAMIASTAASTSCIRIMFPQDLAGFPGRCTGNS